MELMKRQGSSPYTSAPSSPPHPLSLLFYSTPNSPRFSCHERQSFLDGEPESYSSIPFDWEVMPGIPKSVDVEFEFSGQLVQLPALSTADELFDGGKIRALKPPPRLGVVGMHTPLPPDSPKSPIVNKFKDKQRDNKPSSSVTKAAALHNSSSSKLQQVEGSRCRGRGRDPIVRGSRTGGGTNIPRKLKGVSRSLSPLRVSEFAMLNHQQQEEVDYHNSISNTSSKKWRLKDLFLFRSSSEGNNKYHSFLSRRNSIDNNNDDSLGWVSKRGHEMNYSTKKRSERAVSVCSSDDMNKMKTTLPYRHALLGCLGFNPFFQHLSHTSSSSSSS